MIKRISNVFKGKGSFVVPWFLATAIFFVGSILTGTNKEKVHTVKEVMYDAVMHEIHKVNFFGIKEVNPAFISAVTVSMAMLVSAALIRFFIIPKFQYIPGKFQLILEEIVGFFDNLAKQNSPHRNSFLGTYVFCAGSYIFISTLFELLGLQCLTSQGHSISLPAPLSDINAAIAMGLISYLVIVSGAIKGNGIRGMGSAIKEASLLISMSFRLFGAMISGVLVTELVYHYTALSYVIPIVVAIIFTLFHALIQSYVLTLLTTIFYGDVSEPKKVPLNKVSNEQLEVSVNT